MGPVDATAGEDGEDDDDGKSKKRKRAGKPRKKDAEFGVSRGVDFQGVSTVINVDMPPTAASYTHRVGRTARAGASGALSVRAHTDVCTGVVS